MNKDGTDKYDIMYDSSTQVWTILIMQGKRLTEQEFLEATRNSEGEPGIWRPIEYKMDGNTGEIISVK